MITRVARLAMLLAIAALAFAPPKPTDASVREADIICIFDEEPDDDGIICGGCGSTTTGCIIVECCDVDIGICLGVISCPA